MFSEVLKELKTSFYLKKNHLVILKLLSAEACTADEICARTTIPKGRIYNLLNELIEMKLIEREDGVPAVYSMRNPNDRILDFLQYKFEKEMEKQSRLLSLLEEKTKIERVEVITDNRGYDYELIGLISKAEWLKTIHRELSISWFIQPRDEEEFWKIRQVINKRRRAATTPSKEISLLKYRAYMDFYMEKPIEQIMTKEALDAYVKIIREIYGNASVKKWAGEILEDLKNHKNVKLFILDTASSVFNTYVSDREVLLILVFMGEISGIRVIGKRVSDLYEKAFEELRSRATPIEHYLEKLT